MLRPSARLLRLLALLQSRRSWAGSELAERLEVTERTLRRDVDRLRELGYPVQGAPGVAGGYQLGAGASLPPLLLDDDEALSISLALRMATTSAVSGIEESAVRALVKLERVMPPRLRKQANALRASIFTLERAGPRVDSELLAALAAACSDRYTVVFEYQAKDGARSQRELEPAGLVHTGYRWYLVGWDTTRDDWRTFRVDRIASKPTQGPVYTPRPLPCGGDLRAYVSQSISTDAYEFRARVVLHAPRETIVQRFSAAAGMLEVIDEERCVLVTGAPSLDHMVMWLTFLNVDFEVEEPRELIERLSNLRKRLGRAVKASR